VAKNIGIDPRKARAAMMLTAGVSSIKVAKVLKITVRTLQRWQAEAGFTDLKNDVVSDLTTGV
jgi:transposase